MNVPALVFAIGSGLLFLGGIFQGIDAARHLIEEVSKHAVRPVQKKKWSAIILVCIICIVLAFFSGRTAYISYNASSSISTPSSPTQRETPTEGISLSLTPTNTPIPTGTPTLASTNTPIPAGTPTPSPTPIPISQLIYGPELLSNPGFEMGNYAYWSIINGSDSVITSHSVYCNQPGRAYEGNCFEEANSNQPDGAGSIYQDITLATLPGQSYTLSCWFRSPTNVPFSVVLALWNAGGSKHESVNQSIFAGSTWQQVSLNLMITMQNPTIRAQIYLGTAVSNLDIDACSLRKMLS